MIKDELRERSQRDTEPLRSLPRDSGHIVLFSCWWTHQPGSSIEPWCPQLILRSYYKHDWLNNWQQIDSISSSFPGGWAAESSNPLTTYLAFLMTSPDPKPTWGLTTSHLISTDTHSTLGFLKLCDRNWGQRPDIFFLLCYTDRYISSTNPESNIIFVLITCLTHLYNPLQLLF